MNTPAHLIFGATAFGKAGDAKVTAAAIAGALVPDLSLYLLVGWQLLVLGTEPKIVFDVMYYSETWQLIFSIDNSFLLWGAGLGFALWAKKPVLIAFAAAALLHLALDFPLHNDDARAHFWPVTDWRFFSPVSYWDPDHHSAFVVPIEMAASLACLVVLWGRHSAVIARCVIAAAGLMQIAPGLVWLFVFDG